jgi:hypothetical protein
MNATKRPVSVTILACVYLLVGTVGFVYHFRELMPLQRDGILVELTELLAAVAGGFMLRGRNWARWLALAWMAFHVAISMFDPFHKLAVHAGLFVVIAWILLRPAAARYFRGSEAQAKSG